MLDLLIEVCLTDRPGTCTERLVPGMCTEARALEWTDATGDLDLKSWACVDPARRAPLEMVEVAAGVYVHQGRVEPVSPGNAADQANIGFVIGETEVAVIDAGGSRVIGERLYAAIRARTDLPIGYAILTHMHPDHTYGASVFREAGAAIVGHEKLGAALANRIESYTASLLRDTDAEIAMATPVVLPDITVTDATEIDLGDRILALEAHPTAHTDNDLTVRDRTTDTWWMGDLVFDRHLPAMDGSVRGWLALLDRLGQEPAARVVPGHGAATLPWPDAMGPTRDYLAALVEQTRAAIAAGESLGTATKHLGQDLRGDWLLFDAFNARNATAIYRELEWE